MIESVQYIDEEKQVVNAVIDGQPYAIPTNGGNRHWQMIQTWVAEGNVIIESVAPEPEPAINLHEEVRLLKEEIAKMKKDKDK